MIVLIEISMVIFNDRIKDKCVFLGSLLEKKVILMWEFCLMVIVYFIKYIYMKSNWVSFLFYKEGLLRS